MARCRAGRLTCLGPEGVKRYRKSLPLNADSSEKIERIHKIRIPIRFKAASYYFLFP